jgi:hypothetical protein
MFFGSKKGIKGPIPPTDKEVSAGLAIDNRDSW